MHKQELKAEKGNCLEVAGRLIMDLSNAVLVHARVDGQRELKGRRILHAWIEINNWVLDFSNGHTLCVKKRKYYAVAKPKPIKKYSREEACALMLESGNFGQWDKCFDE